MSLKFRYLLTFILFLTLIFYPDKRLYSNASNQAICGVEQTVTRCIDPAWPTSRVLSIWVTWPNISNKIIPDFVDNLETDLENFYSLMSYGQHQPDLVLIRRPGAASDSCYVADKEAWEYSGTADINEEIIQKVYNDYPNAFIGADLVMVNYLYNLMASTGLYVYNQINLPGIYIGTTICNDWLTENAYKWQYAHEYGHALGLNHTREQVGIYDLMQNKIKGSFTCPLYIRQLDNLNWINSSRKKLITAWADDDQTVTLQQVRSGAGQIFCKILFIGVAGTETFIISNHQPTNIYDGDYAGSGLLLWHDRDFLSYGVDVECAVSNGEHGHDHLEDRVDLQGRAEDFFHAANKSQITPWTNPGTENGIAWYGTHNYTGFAITNISVNGNTMTLLI